MVRIRVTFWGVFNKTIIRLVLVEYEMIISSLALRALLAIISSSMRAREIIVNYFAHYLDDIRCSLDYSLNCTPLGPITMTNRVSSKSDEREERLKLRARLLPELYDTRSNY